MLGNRSKRVESIGSVVEPRYQRVEGLDERGKWDDSE